MPDGCPSESRYRRGKPKAGDLTQGLIQRDMEGLSLPGDQSDQDRILAWELLIERSHTHPRLRRDGIGVEANQSLRLQNASRGLYDSCDCDGSPGLARDFSGLRASLGRHSKASFDCE